MPLTCEPKPRKLALPDNTRHGSTFFVPGSISPQVECGPYPGSASVNSLRSRIFSVAFRQWLRWFPVVPALLMVQAAGANGAREFLIQNWTRDLGLPGNTVTTVAQTPDGYLWVGTLGGLARFDGVRFLSMDLRRTAGVSERAVVALFADRQRSLWIGSGDGALVRYAQGTFTVFRPPSRQTADRPLRRLAETREGALWMLNFEGAVYRFAGGAFQPGTDRSDLGALTGDLAGGVWAASRSELYRDQGGQLAVAWSSEQEPGFQPAALAVARSGGCWVAGNGTARRFAAGQWRETRGALPDHEAAWSGFLEDGEGSLWLSSYGGGVSRLGRDGTLRRLTRETGLPSNLVRCLFADTEGDLWAGLEGKGLVRIRHSLFASYSPAEGLSSEAILCGCEGEDGEVWLGTNGDGVQRIQAGQIRQYGFKEGLTNQFVWSLLRDREGRVWAGTWGGGLFRFEGERFVEAVPELGPGAVVLALHEDARGTLWLGQRRTRDRHIDALEGGRRHTYEIPGDQPRIDVRGIAETPDGSLWFGTVEDGLLRYQNGAFRRCGGESGVPPGTIAWLAVDDTGALWVAVEGVGLARWDGARFETIPATRQLLAGNVNQITDDGRGCLWCGLDSGIVRLKKESLRDGPLEWERFSKADGLPGNECSGGGFRARDGRIWFLTATGVAVIDPRQVTAQAPPPVLIEEALVAGKPLAGDGRGQASLSTALRIPPGSGQLEISFTALSFTAPERLRFRYRLAGLPDSLVEAGSARLARYNYLPQGKYKFEVTACREGGPWSETWATLAFEVLPHYWETWWFRLFGLSLLVAAAALAGRWAVSRRLQRRMVALEHQRALEAERSRIAQDLHDDLGTSLTEIHFLTAAAGGPASTPAEVKASLEAISNKSLELVTALDEIVWAVNPKNDSLRNLANYLCLFAQDFLRPAAIQCRLDVPPGLPDLPLNSEQRHTLFLVTKEALANAAKHSAASEVWLRLALQDSRLRLRLEDNGRGFDAAAIRPGGNGLKNIAARMEQLGGHGAVRSVVGQGTRVELELPLK